MGNTSRLLKDWQALPRRGDNLLPHKSTFGPHSFPTLVADLHLLQRQDDGDFMVRFLGADVVQRMGFDPTGGSYRALFSEGDWAHSRATLNNAMDCPCGLDGWRVGQSNTKDSVITIKGRYLPLVSQSGAVDYLVAVSEILNAKDQNKRYLKTAESLVMRAEWVDIGFGTPSEPTPYSGTAPTPGP